jgi:hypothetical protein
MSGQDLDSQAAAKAARRGWIAIAIVALAYMLWCALIYTVIGDRDRTWLYGDKPAIPGESVLSVERVPGGVAPQQPLPADPLKESPILQRDPLPPPLSPAAEQEVAPDAGR